MVLGELDPEISLNSSTKRKFTDTQPGCAVEKQGLKRVITIYEDKENIERPTQVDHKVDVDGPGPFASPMSSASQETVADLPESGDTIPDPDLPSSSSTGKDAARRALMTPPQSLSKRVISTPTEDARTIATNMKCRLKLAMYKMQCHKEELNYKNLMPRKSPAIRIGALPTPASQQRSTQTRGAERQQQQQQLKTPGGITSIVSNERSVPSLMQRSSSGDASISETPIRRNYDIGLSSPPHSQEALPLYTGPKLPDVRLHPNKTSGQTFRLPSMSDLTASVNSGRVPEEH